MDMEGISLEHLTAANIELVRERVRIGCSHYPNRGARLLVINVPGWVGLAFGSVAPLLSDSTKAKLHFLTVDEVRRGALSAVIAEEELPAEYGGRSPIALGHSAWERDQRRIASGALSPSAACRPALLQRPAPAASQVENWYLEE
jgi:hypothetical protein